jgi:alkylhydroperoxidase/carboxymuconolactone decarboxylase family protein YurZ
MSSADVHQALGDTLRELAHGVVPPRQDLRPAGLGSPLDDRSRAIAGLGALLATGGSPSAYRRRVADALAVGVSAEEIVDILIDVAPTLGLARLVPGAVEIALALGHDIDRALEGHDDVDDAG